GQERLSKSKDDGPGGSCGRGRGGCGGGLGTDHFEVRLTASRTLQLDEHLTGPDLVDEIGESAVAVSASDLDLHGSCHLALHAPGCRAPKTRWISALASAPAALTSDRESVTTRLVSHPQRVERDYMTRNQAVSTGNTRCCRQKFLAVRQNLRG